MNPQWAKIDLDIRKNHKHAALRSVGARLTHLYVLLEAHRAQSQGSFKSLQHLRECCPRCKQEHFNALLEVGVLDQHEDGTISVHDYDTWYLSTSRDAVRKRDYRDKRRDMSQGRVQGVSQQSRVEERREEERREERQQEGRSAPAPPSVGFRPNEDQERQIKMQIRAIQDRHPRDWSGVEVILRQFNGSFPPECLIDKLGALVKGLDDGTIEKPGGWLKSVLQQDGPTYCAESASRQAKTIGAQMPGLAELATIAKQNAGSSETE